jgi:hypothetical protein
MPTAIIKSYSIDRGAEYYERRYRRQQIEFLSNKAAKLGFQITLAHT